jgi:hypothetical protein
MRLAHFPPKENQRPIHRSNLASLIPTHSPLEASIERAVRAAQLNPVL